MSNQTFVKKDRISFAENLNEQEVIAPFSNALYVGPNSGITYDGGSNVVSINYLAGVTLSNQYIYADGTYLSNLPTAITSANLVSTVVGLGTIGYISTATGGGLTQSDLTSSITGLATFGYISSTQFTSTVTGLGNIYLSTNSVPSTIIGLGTFGYLSSFNSISTNNISAGNLFANIANTSTISNTDGIFTNSLSTGNLFANVFNGSTINILDGISTTSLNTLLINSSTINNLTNICTTRLFTRIFSASDNNYISIGGLGLNSGAGASLGQAGFQFNNIFVSNVFTSNISAGTISTRNLGVSTLFFSVAQGYQISTNRIVGETRTENLYPLASGAIIGYGSNTGEGGFYNEGHFRSTFTQTIQPTLDNNSFSNVVRINGNVSSQNIFVSSIFGTLISTNTLATNNLLGVGTGGAIYSQNFYPQGVNILGYGTGGPGNGPWDSASIRLTQTSSIVTNNISAGVISVSSIRGNGSQLFNLNAISSLSLESTIIGLGTFGYISSAGSFQGGLTSSLIGLGTFGYISTQSLTSTVTGLGNIYISSFNGSTNFISSGQGSIYTLNTSSITTEYITTQGGILTFSNSDLIPSVDDTYNLGSATNRWRELYIAGTSIHLGNSLVLSEDSSGRLSTNKIIFTPGLDLDNEAITNVLQTQTVTSGATNATIPQTLFYPTGTVEIIDDYVQIQPDPPLSPQYLFKNLGNFQYFKVSCSLSGSGVGVPISFYFELAKKVGEVTVKFGGDLVNDGNPYYSIPNPMIGGDIHNISYVDRYNLTGLATNDIFFPLLWVRTESSVAQFDAGVGNIFLTIEPIISYTS